MGNNESSQKQKTTQTSKIAANIQNNLDWKQQIQTDINQVIDKSQVNRAIQNCTGMSANITAGQNVHIGNITGGADVAVGTIRNVADLSTVQLICAHTVVQNPTSEAGIALKNAQAADMAAGISNTAQANAVQAAVQSAEASQSQFGIAGSLGGLTSSLSGILPIAIVAIVIIVILMLVL